MKINIPSKISYRIIDDNKMIALLNIPQIRNGPSKQRRRQKRPAAEQAEASLSSEEKDVLKENEKAVAEVIAERVIIRAEAKVAEKVIDNIVVEEMNNDSGQR